MLSLRSRSLSLNFGGAPCAFPAKVVEHFLHYLYENNLLFIVFLLLVCTWRILNKPRHTYFPLYPTLSNISTRSNIKSLTPRLLQSPKIGLFPGSLSSGPFFPTSSSGGGTSNSCSVALPGPSGPTFRLHPTSFTPFGPVQVSMDLLRRSWSVQPLRKSP